MQHRHGRKILHPLLYGMRLNFAYKKQLTNERESVSGGKIVPTGNFARLVISRGGEEEARGGLCAD